MTASGQPAVGPDELAERFATIAVELVTRVRDDAPAEVHCWLAAAMEGMDWLSLAIVLAAAVPVDESWKSLTAWTWFQTGGGDGDAEPVTPAGPEHRVPDEVAVDLARFGDPGPLTIQERGMVIARLSAAGNSARSIAQIVGVSRRQVQRHRAGEVRHAQGVA